MLSCSDIRDSTITLQVSEAISKALTENDLRLLLFNSGDSTRFSKFLFAWIWLHKFLDNPASGPACECPFIYFFVKHSLKRGLGVPKLALAL